MKHKINLVWPYVDSGYTCGDSSYSNYYVWREFYFRNYPIITQFNTDMAQLHRGVG